MDCRSSHPVLALDFYPTFAALAGAALPKQKILDGKNIWPDFLAGKDPHPAEPMFWLRHHGTGNEVAVRRGNLKAYRKNFGPWKVYDVATDPTESKNLAKANAELLAILIADGLAWSKTHQEPQWHDTKTGMVTWEKCGMPKYKKTFQGN